MTSKQYIELLKDNQFKVIKDGDAVIIISNNARQDRTAINYQNISTVARRYESAKQAARVLLDKVD